MLLHIIKVAIYHWYCINIGFIYYWYCINIAFADMVMEGPRGTHIGSSTGMCPPQVLSRPLFQVIYSLRIPNISDLSSAPSDLHFQAQFYPILAKFQLLRPIFGQKFVSKTLVSRKKSISETLLLKVWRHRYTFQKIWVPPPPCDTASETTWSGWYGLWLNSGFLFSSLYLYYHLPKPVNKSEELCKVKWHLRVKVTKGILFSKRYVFSSKYCSM